MKYSDFVKKVSNINYFTCWGIPAFKKDRTLKNQLVGWQRQGRVHALKRGLYTLNDDERQAPISVLAISNALYTPSYISLESALSFWGLIPERVSQVTAITPKKTARFKNHYGAFQYHHVKKELFFGYISMKDDAGLPVLIATPEKAILDKVYFDTSFRPEEEYFLGNLRLQNYERLSKKRIHLSARESGSKKVLGSIKFLISLIEAARR